MKFTLEIPDEKVYLLGDSPLAALQATAERELERLWHVERSRPRERKAVGRPILTALFKEVRALGAELLPIYDKLRRMYGDQDFERLYGQQFTQVQAMIEEQDAEGLRQWLNTQPWTRR